MFNKTLTERCTAINILLDVDAIERDKEGVMKSINKRKLVNAIAEALIGSGAVMFKSHGLEPASNHYRFQVIVRAFDKKPGLPDDFEV